MKKSELLALLKLFDENSVIKLFYEYCFNKKLTYKELESISSEKLMNILKSEEPTMELQRYVMLELNDGLLPKEIYDLLESFEKIDDVTYYIAYNKEHQKRPNILKELELINQGLKFPINAYWVIDAILSLTNENNIIKILTSVPDNKRLGSLYKIFDAKANHQHTVKTHENEFTNIGIALMSTDDCSLYYDVLINIVSLEELPEAFKKVDNALKKTDIVSSSIYDITRLFNYVVVKNIMDYNQAILFIDDINKILNNFEKSNKLKRDCLMRCISSSGKYDIELINQIMNSDNVLKLELFYNYSDKYRDEKFSKDKLKYILSLEDSSFILSKISRDVFFLEKLSLDLFKKIIVREDYDSVLDLYLEMQYESWNIPLNEYLIEHGDLYNILKKLSKKSMTIKEYQKILSYSGKNIQLEDIKAYSLENIDKEIYAILYTYDVIISDDYKYMYIKEDIKIVDDPSYRMESLENISIPNCMEYYDMINRINISDITDDEEIDFTKKLIPVKKQN